MNISIFSLEDDVCNSNLNLNSLVDTSTQIYLDSISSKEIEVQTKYIENVNTFTSINNKQETISQTLCLLRRIQDTLSKFGGSKTLIKLINPDHTFEKFLKVKNNLPSYESFDISNIKNNDTQSYLNAVEDRIETLETQNEILNEQRVDVINDATSILKEKVLFLAEKIPFFENIIHDNKYYSEECLDTWRNEEVSHCLTKEQYETALGYFNIPLTAESIVELVKTSSTIQGQSATISELGFVTPSDINIEGLKQLINNVEEADIKLSDIPKETNVLAETIRIINLVSSTILIFCLFKKYCPN